MGRECEESLGINLKTFQLELYLKPGTLVVFVVVFNNNRGGRGIEEEEGGYLWSTRGTMEEPRSSFDWS